MLLGGREDVEDAAAHRQLAAALDQVVALVAQLDEPRDQIVQRGLVARDEPDRLDIPDAGDDRLEEGADRGHHHVDRQGHGIGRVGVRQAPHDGDATADGV